VIVTTRSEAETVAAGRELARTLTPGSIVLLDGELGSGKTAFVRGLAAGLGIDPDEVSSPTFTIVQEYRGGRAPLYHVDLYRLRPAEVDDLGLDEMAQAGGVMAVEWPERLPRPWTEAVRVRIRYGEGTTRTIEVESAPDRPTRSGSSAPPS
jgi:tRNA threonylcarbamoyladenosine biosynthesis protein TsaE